MTPDEYRNRLHNIPDRIERVALCLYMDQYENDPMFTKRQKRELQKDAFLDWPCLCQHERSKWMNRAAEKMEREGIK